VSESTKERKSQSPVGTVTARNELAKEPGGHLGDGNLPLWLGPKPL